ncbi:MAG: MotA/TolQ/ExbB proton channel family protein [Planctomycetaceae bacterium]|jgi:biopolymer transport protein ExbB/TolQ|nr:MotA/TolQ/ExbB proton channel family protein [Planctomycetaceae bacterium]
MFGSLFSKFLKSPLLWGGLASFAFYAALNSKIITNALVVRYTANHPTEYAITAMFFVGMASICLRFFDVRQHWSRLRAGNVLEPQSGGKLEPQEAARLIEQADDNLRKNGESLHAVRIRTILNNIRHSESADKLDDDLRSLADDDYADAEAEYGFVKLIIWAIPILGFLGTVIGIALAMGHLSPEDLEKSLPNVMGGLTVAFDTTALALTLSMIIYFSQHSLWRDEQKMLNAVSRHVDNELRGRFTGVGTGGNNGQLVAVRMMIEVVLETLQDLIQNQSDIWERAMQASQSQYANLLSEIAAQIKTALIRSIQENAEHHALTLVKAEQDLIQNSKRQILDMSKSIEQSAASLRDFQQGALRQSETLRDVVNAMGDVAKIENQLNHNLAALAESRYFEETLNSLAAAVHLLSSKQSSMTVAPITLKQEKEKGQAA